MGFVLLPYVAFLLPDGTCVPLPLPYYHFFPAFRFWSLSLTSTLIADGKVTRLVCCLPFEIPFPWGPNGDRCCWHHVFKREGKELHKCHLQGENCMFYDILRLFTFSVHVNKETRSNFICVVEKAIIPQYMRLFVSSSWHPYRYYQFFELVTMQGIMAEELK